jgi:hypothetical protein
MPPKAAQGQVVTISVTAPTGKRCYLVVRYADSAAESPAGAVSRHGRAVWHFRVSATAALGTASATVQCGTGGATSHPFTVVGPLVRLKLLVDKSGFSQKNSPLGGSTVSYGLILSNPSPSQDAVDTYVLVNFVDATNRVVGSVSTTVSLVGAGSKYALGDSMSLRTQDPVARLEITLRTRGVQPKRTYPQPSLQRVSILPGSYDTAYVGEVDGEVLNDHPTLTLTRATFSVVNLDAGGQVTGGGTGYVYSPLPSGAREVFLAQSGFTSIPYSRAASAVISISPTYQAA